ncbi:MAG: PAS domain S-box protein [Candidatus Heimdallarchaeota archaeon]
MTFSSVRLGGSSYVVGILHYITKQKQTEALKESERKFRGLVEHSLDGIALVAADGTINFCNIAFANLYSKTSTTKVVGHKIFEFVPHECQELKESG